MPLTRSNRPLTSYVTRRALTGRFRPPASCPVNTGLAAFSTGVTRHGQGRLTGSWLRRTSSDTPGRLSSYLAPRGVNRRARPRKEERYGELPTRNQDTSSLAFRYHPAFHQGGACCVARHELEHGLSAGFDQRQDALSRRLPPTLNRKSSHALVIPDSYPEVALEALPESLLVHASLPAVTDPGDPRQRALSSLVFGQQNRATGTPVVQPRCPPRFHERNMLGQTKTAPATPFVKGAWFVRPKVPSACRDPSRGSPPGLDFAVDSRALMPIRHQGSMSRDR